jgi:hypothetical protein
LFEKLLLRTKAVAFIIVIVVAVVVQDSGLQHPAALLVV